jgi:hypothetical protein
MNLLLVLREVFSHAVKPRIQLVSLSEYLADLNCDSGGREICNMQMRMFLKNERVGRHIDIISILISREDLLNI